MKADVKYLSAGVNQTQRCISWGENIVALAADTGILLYNPKTSGIIGASPKVHRDKITSVRWVHPAPASGRILITTGVDSKAVVWTVDENEKESLLSLHPIALLEHEEDVSMADSMIITEDGKEKLFVVTATTDTITCFIVCPLTGEQQSVNYFVAPGRNFITSLVLVKVPGGKYPVLVCGCHDSRIHIFTCDDLGYYAPTAVLNGHEDWVTSLDVMQEDNGNLLLASGSKDASVRVWRISILKTEEELQNCVKAGSKVLKLKSVIFQVLSNSDGKAVTVAALLDTVLAGHEGLVTEVYWARSIMKDGIRHQPYKLLSCSKTQDRSIIIWEPEEGNVTGGGMWIEVARLGEVGGNMEGYFAVQLSPDGTEVLGCSFQGALHLWSNKSGPWDPCVVVGGHFNEVVDIEWDPHGRYLLSTSKDQTTRLHAPWKMQDGKVAWHEIGRPQVHGYDMACICSLGSFQFASGAEEKVIRGFSAPANSIRNLGQICGENVEEDIAKCEVGEGASVPSLGLSNKSVMVSDLEDGQQSQEEVQAYFKPLSLTAPPTEDQLMQNTLWPEAAKLYGHGHDLMALASSSDGSLFASACKAAQEVDANIIVWNSKTWHQVDSLPKHRLTVTQIEFSPDDEYLLSVSRDRSWTVFKREPLEDNEGYTYRLSDFSKKKDTMHSRVIWSCAWLADSKHFLTASRDKTVAVWGLNDAEWTRESLLNESDEVTAVAVTKCADNKEGYQYLVATGLVNGSINIRQYDALNCKFSEEVLKIAHKHHSTVKRLKFRPLKASLNGSPILASCGEDKKVHIYEITI